MLMTDYMNLAINQFCSYTVMLQILCICNSYNTQMFTLLLKYSLIVF